MDNSFQWSVLLSTIVLDQTTGAKSLSQYEKLIVANYFITLAEGCFNKTVISLGSVEFRRFRGLQFHRLVLPEIRESQNLARQRLAARSRKSRYEKENMRKNTNQQTKQNSNNNNNNNNKRKKKEEKKRAHLRIEFWENSLPLGYVRKYMWFFKKNVFFNTFFVELPPASAV